MKLNGWLLDDARYRAMLDYVAPKCYVEASTTNQGGKVLSVIYNMYDVPVCLKVRHGSGKIDYISVDRIDFWEPYDDRCINIGEYEECGCYYNKEHDDDVVW